MHVCPVAVTTLQIFVSKLMDTESVLCDVAWHSLPFIVKLCSRIFSYCCMYKSRDVDTSCCIDKQNIQHNHTAITEWTSMQNYIICIRDSSTFSWCLCFCSEQPGVSQLITTGLADTCTMIHAVLLIISTGLPQLYVLLHWVWCTRQMSCAERAKIMSPSLNVPKLRYDDLCMA